MLARVADSLYWMNRYLERTEFSARLVVGQLQRLPVGTAEQVAAGWRLLFAGIGSEPLDSEALGDLEDDDFLFVDGYTLTDILTFEPGHPVAMVNCLAAARENAREVRSTIGASLWSSLNREYLKLRGTRLVDVWGREPEHLYRDIAEGIQRFHGTCDSTMRRGEAWCFMQIGRYLERAQLVSSMLAAHCNDATAREDGGEWPMLLRACNAFEAYGREFGGVFETGNVVAMLAQDPGLPTSLRFCLDRLRASADAIGAPSAFRSQHGTAAILDRLEGRLDSLGQGASRNWPMKRHELAAISQHFRDFDGALDQRYVSYSVKA